MNEIEILLTPILIVGGGDEYDCFDCPRCGCQIVAGTRLEKFIELTEKSE